MFSLLFEGLFIHIYIIYIYVDINIDLTNFLSKRLLESIIKSKSIPSYVIKEEMWQRIAKADNVNWKREMLRRAIDWRE